MDKTSGGRSARCREALLRIRGPKWTRVLAPVVASHTRTRESWPAVSMWLPSAVHRIPVTAPLCARDSGMCGLRHWKVGGTLGSVGGRTPTASSMSSDAMAALRPPRRTSKMSARLSFDAEAIRCGLCGAQETERTALLWPGRAWVDSPERRSSKRTVFSDVPTPISRCDEGWDDREWEYGVEWRSKV